MIPDGYYAVTWNDALRFYRLRTSTEGRWAGRQWLNRLRTDNLDRAGNAETAAVLAAIEGNIAQARAAFTAQIGTCFICNRTLTDPTSRLYGIGPVCREAIGWVVEDGVPVGDAVAPVAVAVTPAPAPFPSAATAPPAGTPAEPATLRPAGTLTVEDGVATLVSDYDPDAVAAARAIPGRRWDAARKVNTFPVNAATAGPLAALVARFGYVLVGELPEAPDPVDPEGNREASMATDAELDVPGLGGELMAFQRAGVQYAAANGSVLIADEMGLGKTVEALATLQIREAFPTLIVVPAVVKLNWQRETARWLPGRTVAVVDGRYRAGRELPEADVTILNYDIIGSWGTQLAARGFTALVADESHYLKNAKAQRTKAVKAIARSVDLRLLLTGTPVLNRPVELTSQLDILGRLDEFGGFWSFARRYCGAYRNSYGWDLTGATNLGELHEKLRATCYVRRTKEQVLPDLPAKRRVTVPMEMADPAAYFRVERDLREWLEARIAGDADFAALLADLEPDDAEAAQALELARRTRSAQQAEALVRIEALKQTAAQQKLDSAIAWVRDFMESGKKLVLFAHHRDIVERMAAEFPELAVTITGSSTAQARQAAVDAFQGDDRVRLMVANIQAGGVGITLTAASDVAFMELPWRPGDLDQAEDRCHRIGQEDSVTAWYLLAAETIEETIGALIDSKRGVVEAATDGRAAASTSIMAGLTAALLGRVAA